MRPTTTSKRRRTSVIAGIAGLAMAGAGMGPAQAAPTFVTTRLSISSAPTCTPSGTATEGNLNSASNVNVGGISANGKRVAFESDANNLVPGDTNNATDVFVYNNNTGCIKRVSVSSAGVEGNFESGWAGINADGTKVVFGSYADNLVAGDTNGSADVFVHDLASGTTTRQSVSTGGVEGNNDSASTDGSDGPDFGVGTIPMRGAISADGTKIAFPSWATNLDAAPDTNGISDIFVRDTTAGTTTRVSVTSAPANAEAHDTVYGIGAVHPAISENGNVVTFSFYGEDMVPNDLNATKDVFARDLTTGVTERVNLGPGNTEAQGGVLDFGNSDGGRPSADGRYVAFHSGATNLVVPDLSTSPQGQDTYLRDRVLQVTTLVSRAADGTQGIPVVSFGYPDISPDGTLIAFSSDAPNLVPGDTNASTDVFVKNRITGTITRVSVSSSGAQTVGGTPHASNGVAFTKHMGKIYAAYGSNATNLVAGDTNGARDVFLTVCTGCN